MNGAILQQVWLEPNFCACCPGVIWEFKSLTNAQKERLVYEGIDVSVTIMQGHKCSAKLHQM